MPFLPPPSFQQIKDVPLKIELPEPIKADIGALFATVAAVDGPEATRTFFQSAESVTTRLVEYVDGEIARLTQARFQGGDAASLKQKLVGDPRRQVDQLLSGLRSKVSNDKSDWQRRLGKNVRDVHERLTQELASLPVDLTPEGNQFIVRPTAEWKSHFLRWVETTMTKWSGHLAALLREKHEELFRPELDQVGAAIDAKLVPTLPTANPPMFLPQIPDRVLETRFEAPGVMGAIFETFKSGLNTVAMMAGMIVIPVVGSLMNESPVHIRALVMGGTLVPIVVFAGFQGVRSRKRLLEVQTEKARQELAKGLDGAVRAQIDRFRIDAERSCVDYGQQALSAVMQYVDPFVQAAFQQRESKAADELAKAQIQADRLNDQLLAMRNVRAGLVNQVMVDVKRKLAEG